MGHGRHGRDKEDWGLRIEAKILKAWRMNDFNGALHWLPSKAQQLTK